MDKRRTITERLDDLEKQVWKIRWGLYALAVAVASPKVGGPELSDLPPALLRVVGVL
jgi:hypothetical protein